MSDKTREEIIEELENFDLFLFRELEKDSSEFFDE